MILLKALGIRTKCAYNDDMERTPTAFKNQILSAGGTVTQHGSLLIGEFKNGAWVRCNVEGNHCFLLTVGGRTDGGNGAASTIAAAIRRAKTGRELPLAQL